MKVLHLPMTVGGQAPGLARAERAVGLDSRCVAFHGSPFGYQPDEVLFDGVGALTREARRWRLLARALRWADVVHFNFGASIMPRRRDEAPGDLADRCFGLYARALELRDPGWLRRVGKGVVVTFQGDDARQGDRLLPGQAAFGEEVGPAYYRNDELVRARVARITRAAHRVFALNPDLLHVLPTGAEFVAYAHVDAGATSKRNRAGGDGTLRVAHAPTHRAVKGTRFLVAAVERLRTEGVDIELDLIEGVTSDEVARRLTACDVLVDQLLVGWYGGVAVEAMAAGVPVVCYIDHEGLQGIPSGMEEALPAIQATPASIGEVLAELAAHREALVDASERSLTFAGRWHDPARIAGLMRDRYEEILR